MVGSKKQQKITIKIIYFFYFFFLTGDNELIKGWKFLKRVTETFLQSHGVQLEFGGEDDKSGARYLVDWFVDGLLTNSLPKKVKSLTFLIVTLQITLEDIKRIGRS